MASQTTRTLVLRPPLVRPIPWPRPTFAATRTAVDLDTATINEQPVRRTVGACQRAEDLVPNAALCWTHAPPRSRPSGPHSAAHTRSRSTPGDHPDAPCRACRSTAGARSAPIAHPQTKKILPFRHLIARQRIIISHPTDNHYWVLALAMVDRLEPQTLDRRHERDGLCLGGNEDEVAAYGLGQLRADGVGRNLIDRCDRTHRGGDAGPDRSAADRPASSCH